jgi:uncharacterized membrane protein YiaA
MITYIQERPILRFFVEIAIFVLAASIVVLLVGWWGKWSTRVEYSNGFFIASVVLAAIGSIRAVMFTRRRILPDEPGTTVQEQSASTQSAVQRFFATRSLSFRFLMAGLLCLAICILVAQ